MSVRVSDPNALLVKTKSYQRGRREFNAVKNLTVFMARDSALFLALLHASNLPNQRSLSFVPML